MLDTANDQRWIEIDFEGFQRWVTERYIGRVIPQEPVTDPVTDPGTGGPSTGIPGDGPGTMPDPEQILPRDAFEPRESVKGNIARAMFYFNTLYADQAVDG
ncbi:MAG: hypothetical protein F6K65_41025, partial [Moorea sp. SIO3C2]|nr:hypothetical protein [Moorena sp. SIO3C2]